MQLANETILVAHRYVFSVLKMVTYPLTYTQNLVSQTQLVEVYFFMT